MSPVDPKSGSTPEAGTPALLLLHGESPGLEPWQCLGVPSPSPKPHRCGQSQHQALVLASSLALGDWALGKLSSHF